MKFAKIAAATAALSLAAAPAVAQAAPARGAAPVVAENEMGGRNQAAILVLFALIAVAIGIALGGDDGGDDEPISV